MLLVLMGAVQVLFVIVLRPLLRQATTLRTELEEVSSDADCRAH